MSTIGKINKDVVSGINQADIYDTPMLRAALKKANNEMFESYNKLSVSKIPITPLTEEEIELCEQFDNFVKSQRELPID